MPEHAPEEKLNKDQQSLPIIGLSVRGLVEFLLKSGDIDNRHGGGLDPEALQEGSRMHRKIQGRMGTEYQAEVALGYDYSYGPMILRVEGRADGVIRKKEQTDGCEHETVMIDEIKCMYRDLSDIEEPFPVHLAQAKCYAWFYASMEGLEEIGVQLTYCNLETEEIRRYTRQYTIIELRQWYEALMEQYRRWAVFQVEWKKIRQDSIRQVVFPFPYRPGQKELAAGVYRSILRKKNLFIQASTGVGKTISTVFPAVKAVGEGIGERIFYLTAKTITRTVAGEAFDRLAEQGMRFKRLVVTAKEKICKCGETDCNPDSCPYAKGHYDRINDAVYDLLERRDGITREAIEEQADRYMVCPFELSLDTAVWADGIICDYNYVFDPTARLKRFFAEGMKGDYLFLIDEAHNLVERGREMYSAALIKEDFLEVKRLVKERSLKLEKALERCNRCLLELKRECEDGFQEITDTGSLPVSLMNLAGIMEEYLEREEDRQIRERVLELYFQVQRFMAVYDGLDECYVIYTELLEDGRFMLRLYCVDPSVNLQACMDRGRSAILFSATLLPIDYYRSLLSRREDDYAIYAGSSFPPERRQVLIGTDVSSKYTRRTAREYARMADYILRMTRARKGNYLVFCPSYRMMEEVAECFGRIMDESDRLLVQSSKMREEEREAFLNEFSAESTDSSLIGFCVLGGIFSEGIDLKNDRLIGAAVIGTGLPQICNERELLRRYYAKRGMDGFAYAYRCPGMNKVLQAAGRVIRTSEDCGVILLLDERFCNAQSRSMFPREWADAGYCSLENVEEKLDGFWRTLENDD